MAIQSLCGKGRVRFIDDCGGLQGGLCGFETIHTSGVLLSVHQPALKASQPLLEVRLLVSVAESWPTALPSGRGGTELRAGTRCPARPCLPPLPTQIQLRQTPVTVTKELSESLLTFVFSVMS